MIVAVINTKGGTGKTTTSVFIAHGLAKYGKTMLIDSDPQGSAMTWSKIVGSDFKPSTIPLAVADLKDRIPAIAESFKHVVIDSPPGEGMEKQRPITESAILAADTVIVPLAPTMMDLDRLAPTIDLLGAIERRYGHSPRLYILLTRVRAGTTSLVATREQLAASDGYNLPVFRKEIPLYERYANAFGLPVVNLGEYAQIVEELRGNG
jgi:chromosome partitioning protein